MQNELPGGNDGLKQLVTILLKRIERPVIPGWILTQRTSAARTTEVAQAVKIPWVAGEAGIEPAYDRVAGITCLNSLSEDKRNRSNH